MKIRITKKKMLPCCANQKPNLKPPNLNWSKKSENRMPKPKETINHTESRIEIIFKFSCQYLFTFLIIDNLNEK